MVVEFNNSKGFEEVLNWCHAETAGQLCPWVVEDKSQTHFLFC